MTHTLMTHLNKGGEGFASRTACGRGLLRTPLSANWADFLATKPEHRCEKCANSKQAEVNARMTKK
jgi:hypothetical protein